MKKTIALLLAVALIGVGLIASCSDDPKPTPTPEVEKYTVTFDPAGRPFEDGTTAVKTVVVDDGGTVGESWPAIDEENIGTDTFQGWYDGDTQYTRSTKITKNVTLKATFEAALFTFDTTFRTAVHNNFVITTSQSGKHGAWDADNTEDGNNTFGIKTGGIQYKFPVTVDFTYKDYDFVDVEYTATDVSNLVLKHYDSAVDYDAFSGSVTNTADDEKKVVTFEVRKAIPTDGGDVGFAIQKYGAGAANMVIQITKITFKQGGRYTIKFDADGGTPQPADTYLVHGTKVGSYLPTDVTREGYIFAGWIKGSAGVNAGDTVDNSFNGVTLKPLWLVQMDVDPIDISATIDNVSKLTPHGTATVALVTDGFSQTGANYDGIYVSFPVTIAAGATLANYDTLKVTIEGKAGDFSWKPVWIMASTQPMPNNPTSGGAVVQGMKVSNEIQYTNGKLDLEFTIVKPLAANLSGTIDVSIMFRAGASSGGNATNVEFTNILLQ